MSLKPSAIEPVPPETARVARLVFPSGAPAMQIRDALGTLYVDDLFADLFPTRGQPAEAPWRLALVTVLQFMERLSDRQAAQAVRRCIDWKYMLSLELTDPGFDFSVLSKFRSRLLADHAEERLLTRVLELFEVCEWLKARGHQRTDSTHVLASVHALNRLETVGETLRAALNILADVAPDWLREKGEAPFVDSRLQQALIHLDGDSKTLPELYIVCFGRFEVKRLGQPVVLCSNRNGQAILRYLVARTDQQATMDTLMTILWPENEPEVAHHKLQVAVSALRCSLNRGYVSDSGCGYILCRNQVYQLNPLVPLQTDVKEFLELYHTGQHSSGSAMAASYENACKLYTGPFLPEDMYVNWSFVQREQLSQTYLVMCSALAEHYIDVGRYKEAIKWATAILKEDRCDEAAHRQLMRAYAAQSFRSEALRQYRQCERILTDELSVQPMPETMSLFQAILNNKKLPENGTKIELQ
jgi:DNA-binding SARP family transcriptional activator/transposase